MTPLYVLVAATLLAAQQPFPPSPADRTAGAPRAQIAIPRPAWYRAAGVAATVGEMRLEQKQVARWIVEMSAAVRQGGVSTAADYSTACADMLRRSQVDYAFAQSEGGRVDALLTQVASLLEMEAYTQGRMENGVGGHGDYLRAHCYRLAAQARLLEEVKADPAVIRRHHESQVAAGKRRDESFARRLQGAGASADEIVLAAEELNSEARLAASRAATPAERDATNRTAVESLKVTEQYFAKRAGAGMGQESILPLVTYLRLDAELREVNAAETPPADRVRQLGEQRRGVIREAVKLMSERRDGGLFLEVDAASFRKAQGYLLKSELALAADAEARRVLLERNVEEAVNAERYWELRVANGIVGAAAHQRGIYDRIEAEIRLKLAK